MKALSLWQPWATLIALEGKRIETRGWPAPDAVLGERIAIHAAKGGLPQRDLHTTIAGDPFYRVLTEGLRLGHPVPPDEIDRALPRGAVVCTVRLVRCVPIERPRIEVLRKDWPDEYAFGDYEPGRWAWVLEDVEPVDPPAPARGRQQIFEWEPNPTLFEATL